MVLSAPPLALWLLPVGDLGGIARHAADVAHAGIPGFRTVFLAPDGPIVDALEAAGGEVRVAHVGPGHGLSASMRSLRQAVRTLRPDLVHTHLAHADLTAALARPLLGSARLVTTEHGIAGDDRVYHAAAVGSRGMAVLHHWRLRRTDALIAVSRATLAAVESRWRPPARLRRHVVPNGIDRAGPTTRPSPVGDDLHVVSLARLSAEKRLPQLLEAFARLLVERPRARLTLAGEGPLAEELRRRIGDLGLAGQVVMPGHVAAGPLLEGAHVLALLSVWENCSYAVLDALAHGVGVVAAPVGGNPELLPPHCLVDPEDPDAVAAALLMQAERPAARPRLEPQWPSTPAMGRRLAAIYREALG